MVEAYERVLARGVSALSQDDISSMWVFSAVLGRWSLVKDFGTRMLTINPQVMDLIHENAQVSPVTPDMKILTDLASDAKSGRVRPDLDPAVLNFSSYRIRSLNMKLIDIDASDKDLARAFKAEAESTPDGKDVLANLNDDGTTPDLMLTCSGAYAQLISPTSANPMVLVGPFSGVTGNELSLFGYLNLEEDGATLHTEERYLLKKAKKTKVAADGTPLQIWRGEFTTSSVSGGKLVKQTMIARYEVTAELSTVNSSYFDTPAPAAGTTASTGTGTGTAPAKKKESASATAATKKKKGAK
jgi:hypothetical protein